MAAAPAVAESGSGSANGIRGGVTEAAHVGDERTTLTGFLQRQRDLVAWKLRGGDDGALRSVATASGLTTHGVVRHLENVERSWFREVFAGETDLRYDWTDEDPNAEFMPAEDVGMTELLRTYAEETARCDTVIAAAPTLDAVSATRGFSLRWIVCHMIEETGRHLGHLDLLREQADGRVGEEPA